MTPRRIAVVTPRYRPYVGGVETHVEQLVRHFVARGVHVDVLTHAYERGLPPRDDIDGARVHRFPVTVRSEHYDFSPALGRHLRTHADDYDVVHAHHYHALAALVAARQHPRALVFTPHYHGTGHSTLRRLLHTPYRPVGRRLFASARRVIAVSHAEARLIAAHFPSVASRLVVVPGGVDVARIRAAAPFGTARPVVLVAGRLERYKRVDRVVQAMVHLAPRFDLVVTGDGPARDALGRLAVDLGLAEHVRLVGAVTTDELDRWYRTATVTVSMSTREAMGLSIAEALAAETAVVCSDLPAHRELEESFGGSLAFVPVTATAASIARAIEDGARRGGRPAHVATWAEVADRTLAVIADAVRDGAVAA